MNFKTELAQLGQDKTQIQKNDYNIIRCQATKGDIKYFAIDCQDLLGSGAFGKVFKAYRVNDEGNLDYTNPFAAKIFNKRKNFRKKEAEFLGRYLKTELPWDDKQTIILISEFVAGEDLLVDEETKLHPNLAKLSFFERIDLITQICHCINLFHHKTPATGSAIIHSDIKGSNIRVSFDPKTRQINVQILDFGCTKEISSDPSAKIHIQDGIGTMLYIGPELLEFEKGLKSDIYALAAIFAFILGATNPFQYKEDVYKALGIQEHIFGIPYNFADLLTDIPIQDYSINMKSLILGILNWMSHPDYKSRVDSDEVLQFFTTVYNYCKVFEMSPHETDLLNSYSAKLAILSQGLWNTKIDIKDVKKYKFKSDSDSLIEVGVEKQDSTFEQYDFSSNPKICQRILELMESGSLTESSVKELLAQSLFAEEEIEDSFNIRFW